MNKMERLVLIREELDSRLSLEGSLGIPEFSGEESALKTTGTDRIDSVDDIFRVPPIIQEHPYQHMSQRMRICLTNFDYCILTGISINCDGEIELESILDLTINLFYEINNRSILRGNIRTFAGLAKLITGASITKKNGRWEVPLFFIELLSEKFLIWKDNEMVFTIISTRKHWDVMRKQGTTLITKIHYLGGPSSPLTAHFRDQLSNRHHWIFLFGIDRCTYELNSCNMIKFSNKNCFPNHLMFLIIWYELPANHPLIFPKLLGIQLESHCQYLEGVNGVSEIDISTIQRVRMGQSMGHIVPLNTLSFSKFRSMMNKNRRIYWPASLHFGYTTQTMTVHLQWDIEQPDARLRIEACGIRFSQQRGLNYDFLG